MIAILDAASWLISAPGLVMFSTYFTECALGQMRLHVSTAADATLPSLAVLVPAHNEAAGISPTLKAIIADMPIGTLLIVIADNCSDTTADVARAAGAQVIERTDLERRGKGYALAFGCDHLRPNPPQCVLIIDADCVPDRGAIPLLARTAHASGRPVQARNGLTAPPDAAPMVQISNFAFLMKNFVRQRGGVHLGGPALVTGTGMVFPWSIIATAPLASGNIVEDLALGIYCARIGAMPLYCDQARVWSAAADQAETLTQRRRWEHGFLSTARSYGVPLIAEGLGRGRWSLIYLGLHLLVPPLTLLLLIGVMTLGVLGVLCLAGAGCGALFALSVLMALGGALTLLSWARFGRSALAAKTLIQLPLYVLWKIPVYLGFLKKRETDWVRTKRAGE